MASLAGSHPTRTQPVTSVQSRVAIRSRQCLKKFVFILGFLASSGSAATAQTSVPITPYGLNTQVNLSTSHTIPSGAIQYDITGGTRAGTNLFHSFGEFNVPTRNIANFLNDTGIPTTNIIGRINGGNPSHIFGTIQTTGFGNANLFLMNPAGFLFGPTATLNVGGTVAFTSANYLRLADGARFNAIPNADADALLSTAPVAAYGFLGSTPASIAIQGSRLTVTEGSGISLIGGDITIESGTLGDGTIQAARLIAPGGQIHLASVASPGELLHGSLQSVPNTQGDSFAAMGNLRLSQGATLDVSGNAAGTVRIRGGEFVVTESTLSADTGNVHAAPLAIDIGLTGMLSLSNNTAPALTARTNGSGNAGEIHIASESFTAHTTPTDSTLAIIDTHTSGTGQAGRVTIDTGTLDARSNGLGAYLIDSGTAADGHGNNVTITASTVLLSDMNISTGDFRAINSSPQNFNATGSGGNISISAHTINLDFSVLATQAFQGQAGDLSLTGGTIAMRATLMGAMGLFGSGAVTVNVDRFTMTNGSQIETETAFAPGKDITITSTVLELTHGSTIRTQTSGPEPAGNIMVTATDHVTLSDPPAAARPSGFYSNSVGVEGVELDTLGGNAGSIAVTTPRLTLLGGARIDSTTETSGRGGDVSIHVADALSISGELQFPPLENFFTLGSNTAGGVFTRSVGGNFCSGPCGDAGNISIQAGSMTLGSGGQINNGTSTTGRGGDIAIHVSDSISLSGPLNDGSSAGVSSLTIGTIPNAGSGGNILLTAGQSVTISDGASISASSTGPGNAGNIAIDAGQAFRMTDSTVRAEAAQAGGGNIDIRATDLIRLADSSISTSVLGGAGGGGNIFIDPNVVILRNSQILAQAVQGNGGTITINYFQVYLADTLSLVDASSQFGLDGPVHIQSPTSSLSGTVSSLPASLRQTQALQTGRCAALADSQASSLIIAGRDQLPAEPAGWSPSPFATGGDNSGPFAHAIPSRTSVATPADGSVSLRRMNPAGFLTQSFAENGLTACRA